MVDFMKKLQEMRDEELKLRPRTKINFEGLEEEYDLRVTEIFPAYINLEMVEDSTRKFSINKDRAMFVYCDREAMLHIAVGSIIKVEKSERRLYRGIPVARIVSVTYKDVVNINERPLS